MRDILLLGCAREHSSRVPNKMLRQFADTTLFDIYLKKLKQLSSSYIMETYGDGTSAFPNPFRKVLLALNKKDKKLWKKASDTSLEIIERNDKSVATKTDKILDIHHYLDSVDEEYIAILNACFPFFDIKHVSNIGEFFNYDYEIKSLTCAKEVDNYFIDIGTKRIINRVKGQKNIDTKKVVPLLEQVHALHIFPREYFLENGFYWDFTYKNPWYYEMTDRYACLDIDTEFDFELCECLWGKKYAHYS